MGKTYISVPDYVVAVAGCHYIVRMADPELEEVEVLFHPECPGPEVFRRHLGRALRRAADELLGSTDGFIGLAGLVEKTIDILVREYGYRRPPAAGEVSLFSITLFRLKCNEALEELLGRDYCLRIENHNEEIEKELFRKLAEQEDG